MTINECKAEILYYKYKVLQTDNEKLKQYYESKYKYFLQLHNDLAHLE